MRVDSKFKTTIETEMDKEQKVKLVEEIASQVKGAQALIAVDYRGINVPQVNELRAALREADATFRIVKNSLTERAVDEAGQSELKSLLDGPTAFTFVHGDVVTAAKALNKLASREKVIEFKGGYMDGAVLTVEDVSELAKLPTEEQLRAQLVGMVSSPLNTVVRGLNSMIGGLAVALAEVHRKREAEEPAEAEQAEPTDESDGGEPEAEGSEDSKPKEEEPKEEEPKEEEPEEPEADTEQAPETEAETDPAENDEKSHADTSGSDVDDSGVMDIPDEADKDLSENSESEEDKED